MKIRELVDIWGRESGQARECNAHRVKLTLQDSAKLAALGELFPGRSEQQLLSELVSAALDELQGSFPYVQSARIQALDEQGDPIYADAGFGPSFHALSLKYLKHNLSAEKQLAHESSGSTEGLRIRQEKSDRQAEERADNEGMTIAPPSSQGIEVH